MTNNLEDFLVKEKPFNALAMIHNTENLTTSKINREIETTYAHATRIIQELEKQELITREEEGSEKLITLTSKGERVAQDVENLKSTFEEVQHIE